MGTSRAILLAGVYLIIGLYTVGFNKMNQNIDNVAQAQADQMQAIQIAKSGIQIAISTMAKQKPSSLPYAKGKALFGGTYDYVTTDSGLPDDQARVTATGHFGGKKATCVALLQLVYYQSGNAKKRYSNWNVLNVYSQPETENYTKVN